MMSADAHECFATQVEKWELTDIINYVFHLVWTCGVPVHQRYVAALLGHSRVAQAELARPHQPRDLTKTQEELQQVAQSRVLLPVLALSRDANARITSAPLFRPLADGRVPDLTEVVGLRVAPRRSPPPPSTADTTTTEETGSAQSQMLCVVVIPSPREELPVEALAALQPWEKAEDVFTEARRGVDALSSAYWTSLADAKRVEAYLAAPHALTAGETDCRSVAGLMPRLRPGTQRRPVDGAFPSHAARARAAEEDDVVIIDDEEDVKESGSLPHAATPTDHARPSRDRKSRRLDEFFVVHASPRSARGTPPQRTGTSPASIVVVTSEDDEATLQ